MASQRFAGTGAHILSGLYDPAMGANVFGLHSA